MRDVLIAAGAAALGAVVGGIAVTSWSLWARLLVNACMMLQGGAFQ